MATESERKRRELDDQHLISAAEIERVKVIKSVDSAMEAEKKRRGIELNSIAWILICNYILSLL